MTQTLSSPSPRIERLRKEAFIRRLFDQVSPRYDLFNRISSLGFDQGWRRQTIARLNLLPGMTVLDLASGTGDLAAQSAHPLVPLGFVVACDLSYPMLRSAREKFKRIPAARWHVQLAQARAEALPFSDASFHAATMGFALRNVSDLNRTFEECYRVIKPGGRLSLLEFGRPNGWFLKAGHRLWLSFVVPLLGILTTGAVWPFLYLRRSILQFMAPQDVTRRLETAGFTQVKAEPLHGGIVFLYQAIRP